MEYKVQQRKNGRWQSIKAVRVNNDREAFAAAERATKQDSTWGQDGWRWVPAQ